MRLLHLTRYQVRVLGLTIEQKPEGFSRSELRQLDRLEARLDEVQAEYLTAFELVLEETRCRAEKLSQDVTQMTVLEREQNATQMAALEREQNTRIRKLNEGMGAVEVDVLLEGGEYEFLKRIWEGRTSFNGNREIRRVVLAVDDAIEQAETIDLRKLNTSTREGA